MSFLSIFQRPTLSDLHACLAAEQTGSIMPGRFQFDVSHGVQSWYDTENSVHGRCGTVSAKRAITVRGDLFWRVVDAKRGQVFHAVCEDGAAALNLASEAWDSAQHLRSTPAPLNRLLADLRRGAVAFRVQISDAAATPLSALGFRALLEKSDLFDLTSISAHALLRLIKSEPLVADVIHAAWTRQNTEQADNSPLGFEAMC